MSRRKKKFDLYKDPSTDSSIDWAVNAMLVLVGATWAFVSGIAAIAWKLLKYSTSTEDAKKKKN